jgi:hypothetical protein
MFHSHTAVILKKDISSVRVRLYQFDRAEKHASTKNEVHALISRVDMSKENMTQCCLETSESDCPVMQRYITNELNPKEQ